MPKTLPSDLLPHNVPNHLKAHSLRLLQLVLYLANQPPSPGSDQALAHALHAHLYDLSIWPDLPRFKARVMYWLKYLFLTRTPTNPITYNLLLSYGAKIDACDSRGFLVDHRAGLSFQRFHKIMVLHRLARQAINFTRTVMPFGVNKNTPCVEQIRNTTNHYGRMRDQLVKVANHKSVEFAIAYFLLGILRDAHQILTVAQSSPSKMEGRCGEMQSLVIFYLLTQPTVLLGEIRAETFTYTDRESGNNHAFVVLGLPSHKDIGSIYQDPQQWDDALIVDPHTGACSSHDGGTFHESTCEETSTFSLARFIYPASELYSNTFLAGAIDKQYEPRMEVGTYSLTRAHKYQKELDALGAQYEKHYDEPFSTDGKPIVNSGSPGAAHRYLLHEMLQLRKAYDEVCTPKGPKETTTSCRPLTNLFKQACHVTEYRDFIPDELDAGSMHVKW